MKHLPIWIDNLEITENDLSFSSLNCGQLQLTNLNIANNLFTSIPASLPCLAPNLTRLNISYNSLRYDGIMKKICHCLIEIIFISEQWDM